MDMKRRRKVKDMKKEHSPKCIKKRRHKRKCDVTISLCRVERDCSVNDISNVRCHGWNTGDVRECRITTLFNVMKER